MRLMVLIFLLVQSLPIDAQPVFATFDRASDAVLNDPHDLTIGPDGKLYVADKFANRIVVMDPKTLERLMSFWCAQRTGISGFQAAVFLCT